jgi:hypothetical protein
MYVYTLIVYKFTFKENFPKLRKGKIYYETNVRNYNKKKKEKKKKMPNIFVKAFKNK